MARQSTWSLDRRRPIVVLPDVEQAIEIDNLRRYWYVSERSVLSQQFHRPPPQPPPGRPSPTPSTLRQLTTPQRSKSCEFRREYELAEDRQSAAVVQLQSSRQGGSCLLIALICRSRFVTARLMTDERQNRSILSYGFVGRPIISSDFHHT